MSTIIKSIEVVFRLPYLVALPDGEYQISPRQRILQIVHPPMLHYFTGEKEIELSCEGQSVVRMLHPVDSDEARLESEMKRCIGITLNDTNRLIQWYRYHTKHYYATEVVRQQISPIILYVYQDDEMLVYERDFLYSPPELQPLTQEQIEGIKRDVGQLVHPPTADLLLLDAQEALSKYRY